MYFESNLIANQIAESLADARPSIVHSPAFSLQKLTGSFKKKKCYSCSPSLSPAFEGASLT